MRLVYSPAETPPIGVCVAERVAQFVPPPAMEWKAIAVARVFSLK